MGAVPSPRSRLGLLPAHALLRILVDRGLILVPLKLIVLLSLGRELVEMRFGDVLNRELAVDSHMYRLLAASWLLDSLN